MYHVIVNPASKSGKGLRVWEICKEELDRRQVPYEEFISETYGQIEKKVRELTGEQDKEVRLLVFGGDGTMNEVVSGIVQRDKVYVGYIPSGSSNDLARDMGLTEKPLVLLNKILSGKYGYQMDVGTLTCSHLGTEKSLICREDNFQGSRHFNVSCGIGFDAAVCEEVLRSDLKKILNQLKLGKLVYLLTAIKQIVTARKVSCEVYLDDQEPLQLKRFLFVACLIHKYEGGGFMFAPDADYQDGLLDLCVVGDIAKAMVLVALPTALKGKHFIFPNIDKYRARRVRIRTSKPMWVHTDGEVYVKADDILIQNESIKLNMLV